MKKSMIISMLVLLILINIEAQNKSHEKYLTFKIIKKGENGNVLESSVFTGKNKEIARIYFDVKGIISKVEGKIPDGAAVRSFYDNGNMESEMFFKNNKLNGNIKVYYESGKLQSEFFYKDNKPDGLGKLYYENGKLEIEIQFSENNIHAQKEYYENGKVRRESGYKDNKQEGNEKIYHENGVLRSEVNYKDGKKEGMEKIYYENGALNAEFNYLNGKIVENDIPEAKKSRFINSETLDIIQYPNIIQGDGGFSDNPEIIDYSLITIYYDYGSCELLAAIPDMPQKTVSVIIKDPKKNIFSREFKNSANKEYFLYTEDLITKKKYNKPVISIPFKNLAKFQNGDWEIKITIDNDINKTVSGMIDIRMEEINLLNVDINAPFDNYEKANSIMRGDIVYIYGEARAKNSDLLLAVYKQTGAKGKYEHELVLMPYTGTKVKTDENGKFRAVFQAGYDMTKGRYFVVTGRQPELLETTNRNAVSGDFVFYIQ